MTPGPCWPRWPARLDLLRVHRALLAVERVRYEKVRGRIANNSAFLQLVISDPWFDWLRPMAQLVLMIDERTSDKKSILGDAEARVPLDVSTLRPSMVVADVIFNPPNSRLIRHAKQRGCTTLDGLGMLVNQGVIGFRIWTGVDPDAQVMREALEEYLEL